MDRADGLGGLTVADLCAQVNVMPPLDARRAKGFVGNLLERVLGARAGNRDVPDFEGLGVELKSIPVTPQGRPAESTFVCTAALEEMARLGWRQSRVFRKLGRVLFVPVESAHAAALLERRLGRPTLFVLEGWWEQVLRADWEELAGLVGSGDVAGVTARMGRFLQVRPKAAHGGVRRRAVGMDGGFERVNPKGFYLRAEFTERVLASHRTGGLGA